MTFPAPTRQIPPPPRRKRLAARTWILIGVGVILVLGAIAAATKKDDPDKVAATPTTTRVDGNASAPVETAPEVTSTQDGYVVGDSAKTGDLTVIVHSVTDPYVSTNEFFQPDPGKRLITVDVELLNGGDEDQSYSSMLGVELQLADNTMASLSVTGDNLPSLDGTVPAGGGLRGTVVFVAPEGTAWSTVRVKGGLTADGAVFRAV